MAQFGWAYVNCSDTSGSGGGGQAAGPDGSVQFLTGANATSGSANFIFHTASNTLFVTGTLLVSGTISASAFVVNQTDTISGSTVFGNSNTDTHKITGSLFVGKVNEPSTFKVLPLMSQSVTMGMRHTYRHVTTSGLTSSTGDYIIGVGGTGPLEFRIHTASLHNSGAILVIKDETTSRTGAITLSASAPDKIDNNGSYEITGTMPAISLYSNGRNWFVF
tara:strand:+ start:31 stop:690 length:660 start_codon:yes stop_codon:yes gene_type:complete